MMIVAPVVHAKPTTTVRLTVFMFSCSTQNMDKKSAAAPEIWVCAHCLAPEGQHGITLKACTRCKAALYCGRACQTAHWRAGHKKICVTPEE